MRRVLVVAMLLVAACREDVQQAPPAPPPDSWLPAEISANRTPVRLVVMKTGWRTSPAALIVEDADEIERLYKHLAGNRRKGWTCGYHWRFAFEYRDGTTESIDINESCETFRQQHDQTFRALADYFRKQPAHFLIEVTALDRAAKEELRRQLSEQFEMVLDLEPAEPRLLIASREPWTEARAETLRGSSPLVKTVRLIEEQDTGN